MPNPHLPLNRRSDLLFAPRKQLQNVAKMSQNSQERLLHKVLNLPCVRLEGHGRGTEPRHCGEKLTSSISRGSYLLFPSFNYLLHMYT